MDDPLSVRHLTKHYPAFTLDDVSFDVPPASITGFIGRNGAGKTTTLRCLFDAVHPDAGERTFFGLPFEDHEAQIKQRIGFAAGGVDFYPRTRIRTITAATRPLYASWDDDAYRRYMDLFGLDDAKTPKSFSQGMRVKYSLALALSHRAELLILDEPTSGLDPVSRDELLDVLMDLVRREGISILFSTHITSDLNKAADHIIHIADGRLLAATTMEDYRNRYSVVPLADAQRLGVDILGRRKMAAGDSALVNKKDAPDGEPADLEAIMTHLENR